MSALPMPERSDKNWFSSVVESQDLRISIQWGRTRFHRTRVEESSEEKFSFSFIEDYMNRKQPSITLIGSVRHKA